jgi:hypothetical protein
MNTERLALHPPQKILGLKLLLAMGGVYWVCLLPFTTAAQPAGAAGVSLLSVFAGVVRALFGRAHVAALARAAAVLGGLRTPDLVWRLWFAEAMRGSMRAWSLLLTALTIQLALPGTSMHVASGAALLSLALALSVLLSLARAGWLARPLALLCYAGAGALLAALATRAVRQGLAATLDAIGTLPAPLLLAMLLCWPALALWMKHRWGRLPPRPRRRAREAPGGLARRLGGHLQRYQVLQWNQQGQPMAPQGGGAVMRAVALLGTALPAIVLLLLTTPASWGEPLRLQHLLALGYVSGFKVSTLVARDLHWRYMLRPGGGRGGLLANQLLLPNLGVLLATLLAGVLAYALLQYGWNDRPATAILRAIGEHTPILIELLFITSAGLMLRTLVIRSWIFVLVYLAIFALGCASVLHFGYDKMPLLFNAGPGYALALLAASLALLAVAKRRWTPQRLAPFLQGGRRAG